MRQNSITVITKIMPHRRAALKAFLQANIEPGFDSQTKTVICKRDMPFDKIRNLHFASFVILNEDDAPQNEKDTFEVALLFEATFDGEVNDFLDTLVTIAGPGLDKIYRDNCEGYPASGHVLPHFVKEYLCDHDVGYNIFYSGNPGKTAAEIVGENSLREEVVRFVDSNRAQPGSLGLSRLAVQQQIRHWLRGRPAQNGNPEDTRFRWAEEIPTVPMAVKYGRQLFVGLSVAVLIFASYCLLKYSNYQLAELRNCYVDLNLVNNLCIFETSSVGVSQLINELIMMPHRLSALIPSNWWPDSVLRNFVPIVLMWVFARLANFFFGLRESAGNAGLSWVLWGSARFVFVGLQWFAYALMVSVALILLPEFSESAPAEFLSAAAIGFFAITVLGLLWLYLRILKTRPENVQDQAHDPVYVRHGRVLFADVIQVAMMGSIWLILIVIEWIYQLFSENLGDPIFQLASVTVGLAASSLVVLAAVLAVGLSFLLWKFFVTESIFDRILGYEDADVFTRRPIRHDRFDREGHGINEVQNHLVSISRIKGGPFRRLSLRLVLFVINVTSRLWNNRGYLVGVPNIHFLRWVIIDNGKRLLFVDHYHGTWEGYLDAFIANRSVRGLNAMWSHTFLKFDKSRFGWDKVSFPKTACMMWKGARFERPFKEMVRRSQPETLVWYSAYPRLSGDNIADNRKIRNGVFASLESHEIDALKQLIL